MKLWEIFELLVTEDAGTIRSDPGQAYQLKLVLERIMEQLRDPDEDGDGGGGRAGPMDEADGIWPADP